MRLGCSNNRFASLALATCAMTYALFFSPSAQKQGYLAPIKPAAFVVGICMVVALLVAPYLQARMAAKQVAYLSGNFSLHSLASRNGRSN